MKSAYFILPERVARPSNKKTLALQWSAGIPTGGPVAFQPSRSRRRRVPLCGRALRGARRSALGGHVTARPGRGARLPSSRRAVECPRPPGFRSETFFHATAQFGSKRQNHRRHAAFFVFEICLHLPSSFDPPEPQDSIASCISWFFVVFWRGAALSCLGGAFLQDFASLVLVHTRLFTPVPLSAARFSASHPSLGPARASGRRSLLWSR